MDMNDLLMRDLADAASAEMRSQAERELLQRVTAFSFDEGKPAFPFAARLARDNGWTLAYAARAIEEYRRFMFLAVVSGHPVTPSDQVDQAWHLHLLYTHSYRDRFCNDVLQRRIDHHPTMGGREEGAKFLRWYDDTLSSYRRHFGEPPADIWPPAAVRFGDDLGYVRVNVKRNLVVSKARLRLLTEIGAAAVLVAMIVASRWMP
jgi:hypothetical protein